MFFFLPYLVDVPMHRWPIANWILILFTCIISIGMFPQVHRWERHAASHIQYTMHNGHLVETYVASGQHQRMIDYFLEQPGNFQISQLVGSLFLHAGWIHLLGNMFFLWLFGNAVNAKLGHWQFLALYFSAGIFAGIVYLIFWPADSGAWRFGRYHGNHGGFFYAVSAERCVLRVGFAAGLWGNTCLLLLAAGGLFFSGFMGHPQWWRSHRPYQPRRGVHVWGGRTGPAAVAWLGGITGQ